MDAKKSNDKLNKSSIESKDYEIDIPDKKNFFSNLLDKLKSNKKPKLLGSGNLSKKRTTNISISSLWKIGNIRASLFKTIDSFHKIIIKKLSNSNPTATFVPEIISESAQDKETNSLDNTPQKNNIIPLVKPQKINLENDSTSLQNHRSSEDDNLFIDR